MRLAVIQKGKIENRIFKIRGKNVMLDRDLAELYGVPTKVLNQAVKRNPKRFPADFMFQVIWEEIKPLRSQFVTLNNAKLADSKRGKHIKYLPYAFTEQGVAMLSSVLNSERAILVNIQIMRAFVSLRRIALTYTVLRRKVEEMEKKYNGHFKVIFEVLKKLLEPPQPKNRLITGFRQER